MDHLSLKNALAFLLFFLLTIWLGLATAATPVYKWFSLNYEDMFFSSPEAATDNSCTLEYATHPTYMYSGEHRVINISGPTDYSGNGLCSVYRRSDGTFALETSRRIYAQPKCWDDSNPVAGVCPEPPECPAGLTQNMTTPHEGLDLCRESCRWSSGMGVYLPNVNQGYYSYTSTGEVCVTGATGSPLATGVDYPEPPETTTTTTPEPPVTEPGPGQDETTTTSGATTETTTTPHTKVETTGSTTIIEQINGRQVTKTTTTTTTTHADGSQTITTTTDYSATDPGKTVTNLSSGATSTTTDQTKTGSTTMTETKDSGGNTTGTSETSTGVGGDGGGGPEDDSGECGILPQFICDFFGDDDSPPEQPGVPVEEVGSEVVDYDSGLGGGSCPGSVSASFMGKSISYSYANACAAATDFFRPILLAIGAIAAALIIVGAKL